MKSPPLSQKADGQTALLFERADGAPMPVIANIACKREWYADAMGVAPGELLSEVRRRQEIKIKPNLVAEAPFLHNVITKEIDVQKILPLPTYHELDGGPYISAGVFIAQDPDSGARQRLDSQDARLRTRPVRPARPAAPPERDDKTRRRTWRTPQGGRLRRVWTLCF